jgi:hypothetical protein
MGIFRTFAVFLAVLTLGACGFSDTGIAPATPQAQAAFAARQAAFKPATPDADATASTPAPAPAPKAAPAPTVAAPQETRQPFVVIRFEAPDPDFAPALYDAVRGALARRPDVSFDLVAVTRNADAAERNLATVTRALAQMGLPPERLTLAAASAADAGTDEVWIYAR